MTGAARLRSGFLRTRRGETTGRDVEPPPRILVVDDDPDIRELLLLQLELYGCEGHAARDGRTGLAATRSLAPDLLLLDWMMPGMTGLEVCEILREDEATCAIPIIFLTARAQMIDLEDGVAAGADDYVVKPFSPRGLMDRIDAVLSRVPAPEG